MAGLAGGARAETTERVSLGPGGVQANNVSDFPALSADGRFVAFQSDATNLVAGDTNFHTDIFVYDRQNDTIERVSVDSNGVQANDDCLNPAMSADGRFVAFESRATNLIANDTNGVLDVFVHDRTTGVTERVSVDSGGVERSAISRNAAISDDGRYVAFDGTNPNRTDVYVHDRTTGATALMSATSTGGSGNGNSGLAAISSDGRYVAFQSGATNLVPGDTNNDFDIFVRDRDSDGNGIFDEPGGTTLTLVTVDSNGTQSNGDSHNPSISADGRQVAFQSVGTNLVAGDTNAHSDIFVHDMVSGLTIRVSVGAGGVQGNADSFQPSLSRDGRMVAFASKATNLVPNDTNAKRDVFVYDRDTNNNGIFDEPNAVKMERASVDSSGVQGNNDSASIGRAVIAEGGGFVAFGSTATNLVANDTNARRDVFVHETTACGNGILTPDEECDDGNLVDGDGCDSNCTFTACGNGIVTAG
ncbi:MAG TPA: DUF4215 domain-containing protein, partial [Candidatus Bathyarchaeia archaeon]|nr:DUF4215 domain-containing protein [Candidatus Bathyarchaeia archaeon]